MKAVKKPIWVDHILLPSFLTILACFTFFFFPLNPKDSLYAHETQKDIMDDFSGFVEKNKENFKKLAVSSSYVYSVMNDLLATDNLQKANKIFHDFKQNLSILSLIKLMRRSSSKNECTPNVVAEKSWETENNPRLGKLAKGSAEWVNQFRFIIEKELVGKELEDFKSFFNMDQLALNSGAFAPEVYYDRGLLEVANLNQRLFGIAHEMGHAFGPMIREEWGLRVNLVAYGMKSTVEEFSADLMGLYLAWKINEAKKGDREAFTKDILRIQSYVAPVRPSSFTLPGVPTRLEVLKRFIHFFSQNAQKMTAEEMYKHLAKTYFSEGTLFIKAIDEQNKKAPPIEDENEDEE